MSFPVNCTTTSYTAATLKYCKRVQISWKVAKSETHQAIHCGSSVSMCKLSAAAPLCCYWLPRLPALPSLSWHIIVYNMTPSLYLLFCICFRVVVSYVYNIFHYKVCRYVIEILYNCWSYISVLMVLNYVVINVMLKESHQYKHWVHKTS